MVSKKGKGKDVFVRKTGRTFLELEQAGELLKHERAWVRYVMRVQHLFAVLVMTMGICIITSSNIITHPVAYGVIAGVLLAISGYLLTAAKPMRFMDWSLRCLCSSEEEAEEEDMLAEEVCSGCDFYVPYGIYIVSRCSEFHVFAEDENGELSSVFQSRNKQRCMEFADALLL